MVMFIPPSIETIRSIFVIDYFCIYTRKYTNIIHAWYVDDEEAVGGKGPLIQNGLNAGRGGGSRFTGDAAIGPGPNMSALPGRGDEDPDELK